MPIKETYCHNVGYFLSDSALKAWASNPIRGFYVMTLPSLLPVKGVLLGRAYGALFLGLLSLTAIVYPESTSANEADGRASRNASFSFPKPSDRTPIRFEFAKGVIVFKVRVNGHEGWAILDSGAGSSGIDLNFAREAGLALGPPMTPIRPGVGPAIQTLARYRISGTTTISFPGQMTAEVPVAAVDMGALSTISEIPIAMVVGADFLSHLAIQVDFRDNTMKVGPSDSLYFTDRQSFAELTDPNRRLNVKIGNKLFGLAIDLGFNGWISLNKDLWEAIEKPGRVRTGHSKNVSGEVFTTRIADVYRIDAGKFPVWNIEVKEEIREPGKMDGLVGMGFMKKFDAFILDLKARKLWLQPRAD